MEVQLEAEVQHPAAVACEVAVAELAPGSTPAAVAAPPPLPDGATPEEAQMELEDNLLFLLANIANEQREGKEEAGIAPMGRCDST